MSVRKKLENKKSFKFDENEIFPEPRQITGRKSFQSRLFKKADESPSGSLRQSPRSSPISSMSGAPTVAMQCDPFAPTESAERTPRLKKSNTPTPIKSFNYRLQMKSPELEQPGGRLNNNNVSREKSSKSPDKRTDPVLANIVSKLKMQYENSVTGSQHSEDPGDVSEAPNTGVEVEAVGCQCTRPLRLVLCSLCGHTEAGRVSVMCDPHPRAVFPQDLVTCSACKRGGVTFLKEFDLPSGMKEALGGVGAEQKSR